ncbi:MAG: DUF6259 domain-containing protein, partial [Planctomycetia bacterium]|nr:DUF6259 domain-containing protein [Planctomycetia bacterium]
MKTYFPLIFMGLTTVVWAGSPQLELSSPNAILRWNEMGLSVKSTADAPVVEGTPKPVWAIRLLENPANDDYQGKTVVVEDTQLQLQQKQLADGSWEVWYPRLSWDDQTVEISVKLTLRCVNGAFRIHAEVQNDTTRWVVAEWIGPVMAGIKANLETHPILWPAGMGKKVSLPPTKPYEIDERTWGASHWKKQGASYEMRDQYPSQNFTMQWIAFAGEEGGLYLASHDPTRESKQFAVHYFEDTDRYKATILHLPMIPAGGTWEKNLVEIYPYSGDWHVAARHYRQWVDSWNAVGKQKPSWVDKMAGMYLVILKQQNGRFTMWNYEDIGGQLCDYADEQGYDFLALFGWHHGGHDHLYPEYLPAEELGGREGLKKGIAAAKARGKRVYLYANGQLIDRDNQKFWEKEGVSLTIRLKDGSLQHEIWKKFIDSPG